MYLATALVAASVPAGNAAWALNCTPAADGASLATAIGEVNAGSCDTINVTGYISLSSQNLPIIDRAGATITIQGSGGPQIVDGTGTSRLFAVVNGDVTISNLGIEDGLAKGGDGGSNANGGGGAGGALGAGGGLFVGAGATVTLRNVDLGGNTAQGGAGGNSAVGGWGAGAGGGGLNGGAGGSGSGAIVGASGGGGAFGAAGGGNATSRGGSGGGGGGNNAAAGSQGTSFSGASGGTGAGGAGGAGGNGDDPDPGADGTGMGGGGGGGSANNYTAVGDGGDGGALGGGGGGGGQAHFVTGMNGTGDGGAGGDGGFGGGGGGGGSSFQNSAGTWTSGTGGLGGFGAGGGGGGAARAQSGTPTMVAGSGSAGGVLGGDGGDGAVYIAGGGGGGGAGLGGAIFVQNGGTLNIGQNVTFGGAGANNVAGGAGGLSSAGTFGGAGSAAGANIYAIDGSAGLGSNATVGFEVGSGQVRDLGNADLGLLQSGYSGQLRKTGDGELELESTSGFTTGGWSIVDGILRGNTNNLIGAIANDGQLIVDQAANGTLAGDITGTGSLVKEGGGNVTLSGNNDAFTGAVQIDDGTLSVNGSGLGDTSAVTVGGSGALAIGAAGETIGSLAGSGTTTLGGALTTGGNDDSTTYAGNITGSGSLTKTGTGTLTLSGSNSYSGGTTIAAGTLAGTTLSLMGDILNNGTLQFDQAFDGTYTDDISGSGGLMKSGSGTLTLSGSNSYSGSTTINAGTLSVNGTLASDVTVATGATLQGSGSVGSTTVNGLLAPGNSIGTLNVTGNLNLAPSSVFEVEFDDAGNADKVVVSGIANLDGTLQLAPGVGAYADGTQYVILEAGTVNGQFASTTVTDEVRLGGLSATVTYAADEVRLALQQASFGGALGSGFGSGPVADYLDRIRPNIAGNLEQDVGVLEVLPLEQLDDALQSLSPQVADAVPQVQTAFGRVVTDAMEVRLERLRIAELREAGQPSAGFLPQLAAAAVASASAREELLGATHSFGSLELPRSKSWEDQLLAVAAPNNNAASLFDFGNRDYTAWAQLLGEFGSRASDGDLLGYDYRVFGITSGLEQQVTSDLDLGVLLAVGHSSVDFDRDRGANSEQTYSAGAYLGWMPLQGLTIDLTGWGGLSRLDGERNIRFAGMDRTAESETNVYSLGVDLRAKYVESWRNFRLGGFGGVGFLSNWQDSYCEEGAGALNLCVEAANTQQVTGEVGLSAAYDVELPRGNLMIDAELAATATLPLDDRMIQSGFVGEDKTFLIPGDDREEVGFSPRLELTYQMEDESELSVSYNGQFSESLAAHGVQIGLRIPF